MTKENSPEKVRRVLVAGVGNVLRGDDGFGPAVARELEMSGLPANVRVVELGIGGINLVRELMDGYDALVIVDLVDRGGAAGELYVLEPDVPEVASLPAGQRHAISDLHEAVPERTLLLAKAAGILPPFVRIVGCEPAATEEFSMVLSALVQASVPAAVESVLSILETLNASADHVRPQ